VLLDDASEGYIAVHDCLQSYSGFIGSDELE
jgi:hypothetical protein